MAKVLGAQILTAQRHTTVKLVAMEQALRVALNQWGVNPQVLLDALRSDQRSDAVLSTLETFFQQLCDCQSLRLGLHRLDTEGQTILRSSHVSQVYEWLPFAAGRLEEVPEGDEARRTWLAAQRTRRSADLAERFRPQLIGRYGAERGARVQCAEAFEGSEYGASLTAALAARLFPFLSFP